MYNDWGHFRAKCYHPIYWLKAIGLNGAIESQKMVALLIRITASRGQVNPSDGK